MAATAPLLAAAALSRMSGGRAILAGVDLSLGPGEVTLLTGPNGAGKSTLLQVLALLQRPSGGQIRIAGGDARAHGAVLRRLLGVVLHEPLLYPGLTAHENLSFYGRLFGLDRITLGDRIAGLMERVGLRLYQREPVAHFSRGMRQRLTLARSLLHSPPILLWDEPLAALDAGGVGLVRDLLAEHRRACGCALVVTHQQSPLAPVSTGVLSMVQGRLQEAPA